MAIFSGCDNNSGVSSQPEPSGPQFSLIPHAFVEKLYNSYADTDTSAKSPDSSTGTVITVTSDILSIGALAFPALAPVATVADIFSSTYTNSTVNEELDAIVQDINVLQGEITTLQTQLNFLESAFYTYVSNSANQEANAAYNTFTQDINAITDSSTGFFPLFMDKMGIVPGEDIVFSQVFPNIEGTNTLILDDQSITFTSIINSITGSQLSAGASDPDLYKDLTSYDSSDLEELLVQMKDVLYANMPVFNSNVEVSPAATLFKDCNDQITYIYQLTLGALQAAYAVDAAINMINYQLVLSSEGSTTDGPSTQTYLSPLETNSNLYYTYDSDLSSSENLTAYQTAQKELAHVYVARINYMIFGHL